MKRHRPFVTRLSASLATSIACIGCGPTGQSLVRSNPGWSVVRAPISATHDDRAVMTDGQMSSSSVYCSEQSGLQRYDLMLSRGVSEPRVGAMLLALANVPPEGPGDVIVRVQQGYGVASDRVVFVGTLPVRAGLAWLRFPRVVRGDHATVLIGLQRLAATAVCVGEIGVSSSMEPEATTASVVEMREQSTEPGAATSESIRARE